MNLKIKIVYKDRKLDPINECEYGLKDYTELLSLDVKRIISDVEDLLYCANDNKSKEDWDPEQIALFNKIKHKLLDKAGDIERIPQNIFDADVDGDAMSKFVDRIFGRE